MEVSQVNAIVATSLLSVTAALIIAATWRVSFYEIRPFAAARYTGTRRLTLGAAGFFLVASIWYAGASLRAVGYDRIPSPSATASAADDLIRSGVLQREAIISFKRVIAGWSLAMAVGTALGLFAGTFVVGYYLTIPFNSFLRYVPPTAFVTLLIVYFGIGERYKYAVIFAGLFFFVIQMVVDAIEDIDRRYFELALTSGFGVFRVFLHVVVPATMPRVVDIARINLSAAWTFVVVAEVVGAETGLGHLMSVSQRFNRVEDLYVVILTFGVIGVISDRLLQALGRLAFPWYSLHHEQ